MFIVGVNGALVNDLVRRCLTYLDLCPYGSQNCLNLFITEYCVSVFLCFRWQSERDTATGTEK